MPIIRTNPNPRSARQVREQAIQLVPQRVAALGTRMFTQLVEMQRKSISFVWDHPRGLTPQEVCDALGTEAGNAFHIHGMFTQAILDIAAVEGVTPDILLPDKAFTVNADGTVTVLDEPYVPQT